MDYTSIRVGQLPSEAISLTDNFAHEVGNDLKRGTIEQLAIFVANYASTIQGVGFRAVTVTDGQTLPITDKEEFILVGKGTYYNVGGGSTLVLTEELNAIISNGSFWTIGVEIPINVELAGITQTIREGYTSTAPSEDAVFKALALLAVAPVYTLLIVGANTNTFILESGVIPSVISIDRGVIYKTIQWEFSVNTLTILGDTLVNADVYITGTQQL
jgi:hypothetical protein